jgi:hypothetical protein
MRGVGLLGDGHRWDWILCFNGRQPISEDAVEEWSQITCLEDRGGGSVGRRCSEDGAEKAGGGAWHLGIDLED